MITDECNYLKGRQNCSRSTPRRTKTVGWRSLVSVTERTREIGIRKAVGAKRKHIMFQFLCEACVLSVLGGLIGLLLSFAGVEIYGLVVGTSYTMNWAIGGAAIGFCAIIGVAFGLYPAAKASGLQPIDALHNS